ncbi:MAG: carbohydrate ABC transporter permease [Eubacteriales bacterium]
MKNTKFFNIFAYFVAIVFSLAIIYPLLYIGANAMKDSSSIYDVPPSLLPDSAQSLSVYLDYSEFDDLNEDELLSKIQYDHVLTTIGLAADNDIEDETVFEIKFYGTIDGEVIYYSRGHRTELDLEINNGIFKGVFISQNTLTYGDKMEKAITSLGYEYDYSGLDVSSDIEDIGDNAVSEIVTTLMDEDYELEGTILGTTLVQNNFLLVESFIYYVQLPSYIYSNNDIIAKFSFGAFFFNTFFVIGFAILSQTTLCAFTAFSLSKLLPKKTATIMLFFFLGSTMIPFVSIMVPQLIMFNNMGFYDSYAALLLPHLLPYGFFVYLYKGFFDNLPDSLFEAARIDGASSIYLFTNICVPLSKPIIAVVALQTFLSNWNDFFWAWMVTESQELWTLNVALYNISKVNSVQTNFIMGLSVLTIVPVLILTILFSNQIKENIASAGIKG